MHLSGPILYCPLWCESSCSRHTETSQKRTHDVLPWGHTKNLWEHKAFSGESLNSQITVMISHFDLWDALSEKQSFWWNKDNEMFISMSMSIFGTSSSHSFVYHFQWDLTQWASLSSWVWWSTSPCITSLRLTLIGMRAFNMPFCVPARPCEITSQVSFASRIISWWLIISFSKWRLSKRYVKGVEPQNQRPIIKRK